MVGPGAQVWILALNGGMFFTTRTGMIFTLMGRKSMGCAGFSRSVVSDSLQPYGL